MKFDIKALAITCAILWGAVVLVMGIANLIWSCYGRDFLQLLSSFYPGYNAHRNIGEVVIVTLYAIVDGFLAGLIVGWLYNLLAKKSA